MKTAKITLSIVLAFMLICLSACTGDDAAGFEDAIYKSDATVGEGDRTVVLEVIVGDNSVTLTVNTDKTNLGDALSETGIIEGEKGPYGLYVKRVNGILADYDVDATYWSLTKNGETSMVGVDAVEFTDGEHYEFTKTK